VQFFFVPDVNAINIILPEEESQHCIKVLRMQVGDMISVTDGKGNLYEAQIEQAHSKKCGIKIINSFKDFKKRDYYIHIALAPTKNISRTEWFLEKATEIGIDEVTFIKCEHSERKEIKRERLLKITVAAAKQSYKAFFPKINPVVNFKDFLSKETASQKFIAYLNKDNSSSLKKLYQKGKDVIMLIGPEGDFSTEELNKAIETGFAPINLSESRLRTETAALVSCFIIHCLNTP